MTRHAMIQLMLTPALALALALTAGHARAAEECCPVDAPGSSAAAPTVQPVGGPGGAAMPPGHPPVTGKGGASAMPGMAGMGGGQAGMQGAMPPGHPPVSQGQAAAQPFVGTMLIRTEQGTKDGPALADAPAKVVFHSRQGVIHQASFSLDQAGRAMVEDLRFDQPVQPVVTIEHGGATYQGVGHVMTPAQPDSVVRVTVYESQEKPVNYDVPMRHVMVSGVQGGVRVTEILAVRNATDRTWLGVPLKQAGEAEASTDDQADAPHAAPKRSTVVLALPQGAEHVNLGQGFDVCCTLIEPTRIVVTTALLPGSHQYQYSYVIPYRGDQVTLDLASNETVQHLSVFLPEDLPTDDVVGLTAGQVMDNGQQRIRSFNAGRVTAGQPVSLKVGAAQAAGMTPTPAAEAPVQASAGGSSMKFVVGLATVGLLLAGLVVMLRPGSSQAGAGH